MAKDKGIAAMLAGSLPKKGEPSAEGPEQEMPFDHAHKEACARDMMAALRSDDVAMFMAALDDYLMYGSSEE